jgi:hypothetical protein
MCGHSGNFVFSLKTRWLGVQLPFLNLTILMQLSMYPIHS